MVKRSLLMAFALGAALSVMCADVLQLRDKATITGKVLAEKKDQVVVDIGYTVLVVPRTQVLRIKKGTPSEAAELQEKPSAVVESTPPRAGRSAIFKSAGAAQPERTVRELVAQLG